MRTDIKMNINLGDISMRMVAPNVSISLIWASEDDYYIYGEAVASNSVDINTFRNGIGLVAKQNDTTKKIKINLKYVNGFGEEIETGYIEVKNLEGSAVKGCEIPLITDEYFQLNDEMRREIIDRTDTFFLRFGYWDHAGEWVYTGYWIYDTDYASMVLPDEDYFLIKAHLVDDDESIIITDGYERDLDIVRAIDQNEFFLLIASPGSIAHNPITGVGLVSYLNSDIMSSGLAEKINEEFDLDGMIVKSATLDEETGEIEMMSIEKNN